MFSDTINQSKDHWNTHTGKLYMVEAIIGIVAFIILVQLPYLFNKAILSFLFLFIITWGWFLVGLKEYHKI